MAIQEFDALKSVASTAGSTALDIATGVTVASALVKSGFNSVATEGQAVSGMVKATSKVVQFSDYVGDTAKVVAGNQLVTDVVKEGAKWAAKTGNLAGKKGLALGATTLGRVAIGALGAFGAIATGVSWYMDNPEFWTKLSQKCFPFLYKDPQNASWGEIFYSALVPVAVDEDGQTYIQGELLDIIYQYMQTTLFAEVVYSKPDDLKSLVIDGKDITSDLIARFHTPLVYETSSYARSNEPFKFFSYIRTYAPSTYYVPPFLITDGDTEYRGGVYASKYGTDFGVKESTVDATSVSVAAQKTMGDAYKPEANKKPYKSNKYGYDVYSGGSASFSVAGLFKTAATYEGVIVDITDIGMYADEYGLEITKVLQTVALYGNVIQGGDIEGITKNATDIHPNKDAFSTRYPVWWGDAQTSVNPNWQPDQGEVPDKYITWFPLGLPSTVTPDGATSPQGVTQSDYQHGYADAGANAGTSAQTDSAYQNGIIPNPYPEAQAQPSTGSSGAEPSVPSDPSLPPAGIPVVSGGSASGLWTAYNPSVATLRSFGAWLWSDSPLDAIKRIFSNSPSEAIIGLHMIYATPQVSGVRNIAVGYLDSGIASNVVGNQYTSIDCGSVTIPLAYNNALDFGYTKIMCYLPFIGIVPLDSYDVMGKTVSIRYTIDVLTGIVLAQITVSASGYSAVMYTFNGSCAVEYPLTSGSRGSQMLSLITGAVSGAASGGVGGALMGAVKGASVGAEIRASGNLSGNAGAMGIRKPYIIVKRPVDASASWYNQFYGYPAQRYIKLKNITGYARVKDCHVDDIRGATREEKDEIYRLLTEGVILT